MRQRPKRPTLRVKRETVRILEHGMLSDQELGQVMGGLENRPVYTRCTCDKG